MFNQTYASIVVSIDKTNRKIERLERRIAKFDDCPPTTPRRQARLERYQNNLNQTLDRLDYLEEQLAGLSPVAPGPTEDSMQVEFYVDPITGQNRGLNVSITDSALDDRYEGGTDLSLRLSGSGYYNGRGWSSFGSTYGGLISGEFAPVDETKTVMFGTNTQRLDGSYPELSLTAYDASNNIVFSQLIYANGELFI